MLIILSLKNLKKLFWALIVVLLTINELSCIKTTLRIRFLSTNGGKQEVAIIISEV